MAETNPKFFEQLAPFEHYMLADDRPQHPMCFYLKLHFSGTFDREAAESAFAETLPQHPLLTSVVEGNIHGRTSGLRWASTFKRPPIAWFDSETEYQHWTSKAIDIKSESGIRVSILTVKNLEETESDPAPCATTVTLKIHHACADAIGIVGFADNWLRRYHQAVEDSPRLLSLVNPNLLSRRATLGTTAWQRFLRTGADAKRLLGFIKTSSDPIALPNREAETVASEPTSSADTNSEASVCRPTSVRQILDREEYQALLESAKQHGVSVNDLLIRDLFLALRRWNTIQDNSSHRKLRIGVAMNLRTPEFATMPAANFVSMVFLSRDQELRDQAELLESIHRETSHIKKYRMGLTLGRVVALLGNLPGGVQRLLDRKTSYSTTVLSNLGRPFRDSKLPRDDGKIAIGDLRLENVELLPPIRQGTEVVFGVVTYNGTMSLSLHYDPTGFSREDAERLLTMFLAELIGNNPGSNKRQNFGELAELHRQSDPEVERKPTTAKASFRTSARL